MNVKTQTHLAKLRGEIPAAASHPLMPAAGREALLTLLALADCLVGDLADAERRLNLLEQRQRAAA